MSAYLDAMDRTRFDAPALEAATTVRVLGALGPRMLALAAQRADGAHPYLVPPEHTHRAREILGRGALLCPEVAVILEPEPDRARRVARAHVGAYLRLENYRRNLARLGFGEDDVADRGSDRLVDSVVAWGSVEQTANRVREHLDAGADHVALQVLTEDPSRLPLEEWRSLAASSLFW
jgi:probable F420-dependent oxidoreductase